MKKDIHPKYYPKVKVKCACGNAFTIGSTKEFIETEICSKCHPFYTGKEKVLDTVGQVQKFRKRLAKKKVTRQSKEKKKNGKRNKE
jgi:large subunit ribosomal protein L31